MQVLAVASGKSVLFFEADTGSLLSRQPNIHASPIRDLIFISSEHRRPSAPSSAPAASPAAPAVPPGSSPPGDEAEDGGNANGSVDSSSNRMVVTCCGDGIVKIWRTRRHGRGPLQLLHFLSSFTSPVESFCTLEGDKTLLIGTDDGFIHLIDLETLEHIHRMRLPKRCRIRGVGTMYDTSFYVQTVFDVFTFQLVHLHHTFGQFNSGVERLECVGGAVTLCAFEDSAIRIISNKTKTTLPLSTTVPAMSRFSLRSHWFNGATRTLYVLMSNGAIHVYDKQRNPSAEVDVWNALAKNRPLCAAHVAMRPPTLAADAVDADAGRGRYELAAPQVVDFQMHRRRRQRRRAPEDAGGPLWPGLYKRDAAGDAPGARGAGPPGAGAAPRPDDPNVDMLAIGTEDGDVLFIDTADRGGVRRSFPAHRNRPISRICYNYARRVLVTAALRTLRIWSVSGLELQLQITYEDAITCMDQLKGMLIVGLRSGSIRTVDLDTMRQDTLPIEGGHSAMVRDIGVSETLDQFVTCCSQGLLKVFTLARDAKAEFSLRLEQSISCVCYQDNKGNLLAGLGNKIVRVRAKVLAQAPNELSEAVKAEYNGFALGGSAAAAAAAAAAEGDDDGDDGLDEDAPDGGDDDAPGEPRVEEADPGRDGADAAVAPAGLGGDGDGRVPEDLLREDAGDAEVETTDGEGAHAGGALSSADEDEDAEEAERRSMMALMAELEEIADDLPESVAASAAAAGDGAPPGGGKKKRKKRRKKAATIGRFRGARMDPAVQIGLLELKVSEQNTRRLMQRCGIGCSDV